MQAKEPDSGPLVLLPRPFVASAAPIELVESVRTRAMLTGATGVHRYVLAVEADIVHALTPADELVRVSVVDGAVSVVQTGVRGFDVSADNRYIVWQAWSDDPSDVTGDVFLRDELRRHHGRPTDHHG